MIPFEENPKSCLLCTLELTGPKEPAVEEFVPDCGAFVMARCFQSLSLGCGNCHPDHYVDQWRVERLSFRCGTTAHVAVCKCSAIFPLCKLAGWARGHLSPREMSAVQAPSLWKLSHHPAAKVRVSACLSPRDLQSILGVGSK